MTFFHGMEVYFSSSSHISEFQEKKILKMDITLLFTHLKIILL